MNSCTLYCAHSHDAHGINFHVQSPETLRVHIVTQTRVLFLARTRIGLSASLQWIRLGQPLCTSADPAQVVEVELVFQAVGFEQVGQPISLSGIVYPRLLALRVPDGEQNYVHW